MIIARFDSGLKWGDKNLRWGSPSVLLEPGDEGYVADPTSASFPPTQTSKRHKTMAKSDPIKKKDADFAAQLLTFKNNIGDYDALFGLTPAQVSAQAADADYFNQVFCCQDIASNHSQQRTAWKNIIRQGGDVPATGIPVAPTYPGAVVAVAPGVEKRFRDLCNLIKSHPAYNEGIGQALGIEGEITASPDLSLVKPSFALEISGDHVRIRWGWEGLGAFLDAQEFMVDRGAGYVHLVTDTTPNYIDGTPLPATPQKWTYKSIFKVGDARVGQWSDEGSITVGG